MFKTRLKILSIGLGLCFLVILGRLWQLQVTRYKKYHALDMRDIHTEKMVPAMRASIYDRNHQLLAEDRPFYDLAVRLDRLKLQFVTLDEVKAARAIADPPRRAEALGAIRQRLASEPFVRDLANTIERNEDDLAASVLKAFETVARNWASPATPVRIAGGVDEKAWLGLRALHEDIFRDSYQLYGKAAEKLDDIQLPPFPGLVCSISTHRVYPNGRLGAFVIGSVGEISEADEEELRKDGILVENAEARTAYWQHLLETFDDAKLSQLSEILKTDLGELTEITQVYAAFNRLNPQERQKVAVLGLAEPLRWNERPARMQLSEAERVWMGAGMPLTVSKHHLPNRIIGEQGVERFYNDMVRGKDGMKIRDESDEKESDEDLRFWRDSQPHEGQPLDLTISMTWQSAVEKALKSQANPGAIVVLDCNTGEILALASYPDYDPNVFVPPRDGPDRQEKLRALLDDPNKPLLNRAISEQYPLGSVMKSLIAAVALEKGLVTTTETFQCPGYIIEGGQKFRCDDSRAHGTVNLLKGLRCSCNVTFHQIGARIGVENLGPFAKLIFGRRSGIDLPGEVAGIYPDRAWRMKAFPKNPAARVWTRGNDFLLAIGQGQFSSTVLQAAVLIGAVGNGGNVVTPHICAASPVRNTPLGVSRANLDIVREGLDEVVNVGRPGERGTAYSPFHEQGPELAVRVAGKTSTAEHRHGAKPHAWFAGYAPSDHPQIAFAVLLEEAGHGGATAAPVAYKFLRQIYGTRSMPVKNPGAPERAPTDE